MKKRAAEAPKGCSRLKMTRALVPGADVALPVSVSDRMIRSVTSMR